jgi:hypothetical protein
MAGPPVATSGRWRISDIDWSARSKLDLSLQLNHSRSRITSDTTAHDAGRRLLQIQDLPKGLVGTEIIGEAKIGVVQEVEELETNAKRGVLAEFRVLHDSEVGIEISWPAEVVASLSEGHRGPAAGA